MLLSIEITKEKQEQINAWLEIHENTPDLPLYSSVDIRDGGFKAAAMETNLFLAGFHTLCEHGIHDAAKYIKEAIHLRFSKCQNILIIAEEQTRNKWYLENIFFLEKILRQANFDVTTATFLYILQQPTKETTEQSVELKTATNQTVKIYSLQLLLNQMKSGKKQFDLIVMNNDLIGGLAPAVSQLSIPTYPSIQSNWHSRLKSSHFKYTEIFIHEFAQILDSDPWLFSCCSGVVDGVNLSHPEDQTRMMDTASDLLRKISAKYKEHHIESKPFIHVRSDSGASGIGVVSIENPAQITKLNRQSILQFFKRKDSLIKARYLLLEGIPNLDNPHSEASEVIVYQVANKFVGGFYRSQGETAEKNLATMPNHVRRICSNPEQNPACGVNSERNRLKLYQNLSRIAGIAAQKEIAELEKKNTT